MYEPVKEETKELYLKIWFHYSVGHLSQEQLGKLFSCSQDTIANAIRWSAENRIQFSAPILAEAAKEAVETRIRELKNDLVRIKESNPINWNCAIGIQKLIQANEELLWKLQAVIQDKTSITINTTQINQVLKVRDEAMEKLDDGQRHVLATRIREVLGGQKSNHETAG